VSWLFVLNGMPLLVYGMARGREQTLRAMARNWPAGMAAGLLSLAAYWIAIWAMTVAPIALVAALRECSVVFAVMIGIWFGESITWVRALSLCAVMTGLLMLRT
jgi:drug/metabolite transporter (DMT)-like permease